MVNQIGSLSWGTTRHQVQSISAESTCGANTIYVSLQCMHTRAWRKLLVQTRTTGRSGETTYPAQSWLINEPKSLKSLATIIISIIIRIIVIVAAAAAAINIMIIRTDLTHQNRADSSRKGSLDACVGRTRTGQGASWASWELTPPIGERAFLIRPLRVLVTTSKSMDSFSQKLQICALASPCSPKLSFYY